MPDVTLPSTGQRFWDMTFTGKIVFCLKFCLFLATFGYAFPTLLSD